QQAGQYACIQVQGEGKIRKELMLLQTVHQAGTGLGQDKPIWIDLHGTLSRGNATAFIEQIAAPMEEHLLLAQVIILEPVPREFSDHLSHLQKLADDATASRGYDLRIMADESVRSVEDVERLHAGGGCRAINIKAGKTGGLVESLDLAQRAVELEPDTHI